MVKFFDAKVKTIVKKNLQILKHKFFQIKIQHEIFVDLFKKKNVILRNISTIKSQNVRMTLNNLLKQRELEND